MPSRKPVFARARYNSAGAAFLLLAALSAALPVWVFSRSPESKPDLSRDLRDAKASKRAEAAERLTRRGGTAGEGTIIDAFRRETDPQVRARLLGALVSGGGKEAEGVLVSALAGDASVLVRAVAARELGRLGGGGVSVRALAGGLAKDEAIEVRQSCAASLGLHPVPEAVKALVAAASDRDPAVRRYAALGLSRQPAGPERDKALSKLEKDSDPHAARFARQGRAR